MLVGPTGEPCIEQPMATAMAGKVAEKHGNITEKARNGMMEARPVSWTYMHSGYPETGNSAHV